MIIKKSNQEKKYLKNIGENIKKARLEKEYSQPELAKAVGYKLPHSIRLIEKGRVATIDIVLLQRLANLLDTTIDTLIK